MKKKIYLIVISIFVVVVSNGAYNSSRIVETKYQITSDKVNRDYTLALITDYHSQTKLNDQILDTVRTNNPDYILLAGDILDSEEMEATIDFIKNLNDISPVIYERGNHDNDYSTYLEFKQQLVDIGVKTVDSSNYQVDDLNFIGIEDFSGASFGYSTSFASSYLPYIESYSQYYIEDKYNILLAHRPNFLEAYSEIGSDLVVSGHAHGGQWQLPFTSIGLIAPDQGLFATQVEGIKTVGNTTQVISTGTSNPYEPLIPRLFNPKEVVIIEVDSEL